MVELRTGAKNDTSSRRTPSTATCSTRGTRSLNAGDSVHSEGTIVHRSPVFIQFIISAVDHTIEGESGMLPPVLHYPTAYAVTKLTITTTTWLLAGFTGETRQTISVRCQHGTDRPP